MSDKENLELSTAQHASGICEALEAEIPHLRRYARSLVKDSDKADDLVHDGLVRAIEKFDQYQPGTNLRAWLIVIIRNQFFSWCRRSKLERQASVEIAHTQQTVLTPAQDQELEVRDVGDALNDLSVDHREILSLVVIQEMDYETAAEILDLPVGTVKSRLSRARQELKARCEK